MLIIHSLWQACAADLAELLVPPENQKGAQQASSTSFNPAEPSSSALLSCAASIAALERAGVVKQFT